MLLKLSTKMYSLNFLYTYSLSFIILSFSLSLSLVLSLSPSLYLCLSISYFLSLTENKSSMNVIEIINKFRTLKFLAHTQYSLSFYSDSHSVRLSLFLCLSLFIYALYLSLFSKRGEFIRVLNISLSLSLSMPRFLSLPFCLSH